MRTNDDSLGYEIAELAGDAHAKWNPKSIQQWYSTQQAPDGGFCCDRADGRDFYGDYAVDANGNVKFDPDGKHYMIPKDKVLSGPADADVVHFDTGQRA
jgi:hypothetical protein